MEQLLLQERKKKKTSGNLCAFCAQWQNLLIRPFFWKKSPRRVCCCYKYTTALFIAVATSSKANSLINFVANSTLLKVLLEQKLHLPLLAAAPNFSPVVPKKNFFVKLSCLFFLCDLGGETSSCRNDKSGFCEEKGRMEYREQKNLWQNPFFLRVY